MANHLRQTEQSPQTYLPPSFENAGRLARIQALFPSIEEMFKEYAAKNGYPGYAYGIVFDGKLIFKDNGGVIDLEKKIPVTSQSLFRIASMTKSFTAMAILKLRDEGKLRLDDPIEIYLPELREVRLTQDSPAITIRDLLSHSAGFPTDDPWADRKLDETEENLAAFLKEKINVSNPCGVTFEYSNLGYAILGYLINRITGTPYQEYIDTEICQPFGMKFHWEFGDVPENQLVHGYSFKEEKYVEDPLLHDGIYGAMGGLIASVESFSRYIALHQEAWPPRDDQATCPLKRSSIREMHLPWKFVKLETGFKYPSGEECSLVSGYGYGLKWLKDSLGRVFVGHSGGLPGFGSNWNFLPEYGLGIVSFANRTYADTSKINLDVLNKLIVEAQLPPRKLPPSHLLNEKKEQLVSILPEWENIQEGVFASNFFLDRAIKPLQRESRELFSKAGKILSVGEVIPENQLRGHFVLKGEQLDLQINFALTPENPCLIQHYQIKESKK